MNNDQSYQDSGIKRDVVVVPFDKEGNMGDGSVIGQALTYAEALKMVKDAGHTIAPENEGYDLGHIANPNGPDSYGIPVLI